MSFRTIASILVASGLAACTVTTNSTGPSGSSSGGTDDAGANDSATVDAGDAGGSGCDFGEPNDTRDQATPVDVNHPYQGLCVASPDGVDDKDFYVMTAPADAAGGYVVLTVSNVAPLGLAELIVTSAIDNDVLVDTYTTTEGASIKSWFTVSPGAKYKVQISRFGGNGTRFSYDMNLAYTKITDAYEPNQTKADAKPLTLGTPIQASAAAHSPAGKLVAGDDFDWYKVTLAAGNATVKLSNSPADHLCDVELYDSAGQKAGENYTTTNGANCQIDATNLVAGDYTINAHHFGGTPNRAGDGDPPASVTGSYTLVVTQP